MNTETLKVNTSPLNNSYMKINSDLTIVAMNGYAIGGSPMRYENEVELRDHDEIIRLATFESYDDAVEFAGLIAGKLYSDYDRVEFNDCTVFKLKK